MKYLPHIRSQKNKRGGRVRLHGPLSYFLLFSDSFFSDIFRFQDKNLLDNKLSLAAFSPGCKASGRRLKAAQPVGWRGHTHFAILQSFFANGFVRGGSAAANSQWNNRHLQTGLCVAAVPQPIRNTTIVFCKRVCAWRQIIPKPQRETVCSPGQPLPQLGPGAMPLVGGEGATPRTVPYPCGWLIFSSRSEKLMSSMRRIFSGARAAFLRQMAA